MQLGAPLRVLDLDLGTEVRPRHLQTLALGACGRGGMVSITRGIVYVLLSICCWCKLIMHVLQHLRLLHWLCLALRRALGAPQVALLHLQLAPGSSIHGHLADESALQMSQPLQEARISVKIFRRLPEMNRLQGFQQK